MEDNYGESRGEIILLGYLFMESASISVLTLKLIDMKKILFPLMAMLFITACHSSQNKTNDIVLQDLKAQEPLPSQDLQKTEDKGILTAHRNLPQTTPSSNTGDWDKSIIKTGTLTLQVKEFKKFSETLRDAVKQYGGYIANEEQNQSEERIESSVSVKVPVDKFDDMMNQLPASAEKMVAKKISTDDVTGEIVDIKSRLQAKEQMRLKYLEFLKQSKNMEDVLKVQSEINDIQEAIESASGRADYLKHQSAYSTINLVYFQPLPGYQPTNDNPGFFTRSITAFKSGFLFLGEILIGIISIWPMILLGFIGVFIFRKFIVKQAVSKQKL